MWFMRTNEMFLSFNLKFLFLFVERKAKGFNLVLVSPPVTSPSAPL